MLSDFEEVNNFNLAIIIKSYKLSIKRLKVSKHSGLLAILTVLIIGLQSKPVSKHLGVEGCNTSGCGFATSPPSKRATSSTFSGETVGFARYPHNQDLRIF